MIRDSMGIAMRGHADNAPYDTHGIKAIHSVNAYIMTITEEFLK